MAQIYVEHPRLEDPAAEVGKMEEHLAMLAAKAQARGGTNIRRVRTYLYRREDGPICWYEATATPEDYQAVRLAVTFTDGAIV